MKIVDAFWEKRNLGEDCTEFLLSKSDNTDEVKGLICSTKTQYQLAKVPSTRPDLLLLLQDLGFKCIEMNIQLKHNDIQNFVIPHTLNSFLNGIEFKNIDSEEQQWFIEKIATSNMFSTDKIAVDPYFSLEAAGKRYALWAKDFLKNGGVLIGIKLERQWIGFGIGTVNTKNQYNGFLGGIFPHYSGTGFGVLPIIAGIQTAKKLGCKVFISGVSSNNISILQLDLMLGFKITKFTYNLVKHIDL